MLKPRVENILQFSGWFGKSLVASEVGANLETLARDPIFSPVVQQIVESLASAIDAKDRYTKNHSEEATIYAEALGRACDLPERQLELVKTSTVVYLLPYTL